MRNRVKCKKCGEIIESRHRWDFKWCSCKTIFIDGGRDYRKRGGDFEQMIEVGDDEC